MQDLPVLGRVGLILVDLQNDFCHPEGFFAQRLGFVPTAPLEQLIHNVNEMVAAARSGGRPIIWLRNVWRNADDVGVLAARRPLLKEEGCREGSWGADLLTGLDVRPSDTIIDKRRFSGFYGTKLEEDLRDAGIQSLVIGGVRTDYCVESTVRDAFFRDFQVFVVQDAVASYVPELEEATLRQVRDVFGWVITTREATELLEDPAAEAVADDYSAATAGS